MRLGCTFGKLLGFVVFGLRIDADQEKVGAISRIATPKNLKGVLLQKFDSFEWTNVSQSTFDDLKRMLSTPPV